VFPFYFTICLHWKRPLTLIWKVPVGSTKQRIYLDADWRRQSNATANNVGLKSEVPHRIRGRKGKRRREIKWEARLIRQKPTFLNLSAKIKCSLISLISEMWAGPLYIKFIFCGGEQPHLGRTASGTGLPALCVAQALHYCLGLAHPAKSTLKIIWVSEPLWFVGNMCLLE
jgi:hypothetical protein